MLSKGRGERCRGEGVAKGKRVQGAGYGQRIRQGKGREGVGCGQTVGEESKGAG